jgi:dephospho-CoA kinase
MVPRFFVPRKTRGFYIGGYMKVIIISGKARTGKSTVANIMKDYFDEKGLKAIILAYARYIKMFAKDVSNWDGSEEAKPRALLQEIGTDIIRKKIDNDFFVRRMTEDIKLYSYFMDVAIISDARFIDEIEYIKKHFKNTITINIVKSNLETDLTKKEQTHPSETSLDNYNKYDYILDNDGSIKELKEKIISIIKEAL